MHTRRRSRFGSAWLLLPAWVAWAACENSARAAAAGAWNVVLQASGTTAHLQALSVVDERTLWVSGRAGTYGRTTDGGSSWTAGVVPDCGECEFRDVHAFDARRALLLRAGPGAASAVYLTEDAGATWQRGFVNPDSTGFWDCFAFEDTRRGWLFGDSVAGALVLFATGDGGRAWRRLGPAGLPPALGGEGGFAASGTCVTAGPRGRVFVATGAGAQARVLRSHDGGATWQAVSTPVASGEMAGLTSVAFRDRRHGLAAGGHVRAPTSGPRVVRSHDGGATWQAAGEPRLAGAVYVVAWVPGTKRTALCAGPGGIDRSDDGGLTWERLDDGDTWSLAFARSGVGWAVGPAGRIAKLTRRARP